MATMTLDDERYGEFLERLSGPEGINLRDENGIKWACAHGSDTTHTQEILLAMGLSDEEIASSLAYFAARGGFCDCEIVLHVGETAGDSIVREDTDKEWLRERTNY